MSVAKNIQPDTEIKLRMAATIAALVFLWLIITVLLLVSDAGLLPISLVILVMFFLQYWYSDRITLFAMGATVVNSLEAPQIHAMLDRLCALAEMPKPRLAIADADFPNAMATGPTPKKSLIIVNTGLQSRLTDDELYAVLSHEISHIAHRDVRAMTMAFAVTALAGTLVQATFWDAMLPRRARKRRSRGGSLLFLSFFIYLVGTLLTLALSRYRELLADRTGAILIDDPQSLSSALIKIDGELATIPRQDLRQGENLNAFFIAPAFGRKNRKSIWRLFDSHPPLEVRLAQLKKIEIELGGTSQ